MNKLVLLNQTMLELMRQCYEYVNGIVSADEKSDVKSTMISELFRAHTDARMEGMSLVEAEQMHVDDEEADTPWFSPFILDKEQEELNEFEDKKELSRVFAGDTDFDKKYLDAELVFDEEENLVFGREEDISDLNIGDVIFRARENSYYIALEKTDDANSVLLGCSVIELGDLNNRILHRLITRLDGLMNKKKISQLKFIRRLMWLFEHTKENVTVDDENNVDLSFAINDDEDDEYAWECVQKDNEESVPLSNNWIHRKNGDKRKIANVETLFSNKRVSYRIFYLEQEV